MAPGRAADQLHGGWCGRPSLTEPSPASRGSLARLQTQTSPTGPGGAAAQNGAQSALCSGGRPEPAGQEEMRGAPASSPRPGPGGRQGRPSRGPGGAGSRGAAPMSPGRCPRRSPPCCLLLRTEGPPPLRQPPCPLTAWGTPGHGRGCEPVSRGCTRVRVRVWVRVACGAGDPSCPRGLSAPGTRGAVPRGLSSGAWSSVSRAAGVGDSRPQAGTGSREPLCVCPVRALRFQGRPCVRVTPSLQRWELQSP